MKAVEMAIKMEREAINFYTKCAGKTNNPVGKKMFLSIVEDEKYHIACATKVTQGKEFKPAEATPLQDMRMIFEQNKEAMLQRVSSTTDELEALEMAMKMEEETIKFYKKAAAEAITDPAEKAFLNVLSRMRKSTLPFSRTLTHSFRTPVIGLCGMSIAL